MTCGIIPFITGRRPTDEMMHLGLSLEVFIRQIDGTDQIVDIKKRGDVIGEISLLIGAPRTATVRAIDGAVSMKLVKTGPTSG